MKINYHMYLVSSTNSAREKVSSLQVVKSSVMKLDKNSIGLTQPRPISMCTY